MCLQAYRLLRDLGICCSGSISEGNFVVQAQALRNCHNHLASQAYYMLLVTIDMAIPSVIAISWLGRIHSAPAVCISRDTSPYAFILLMSSVVVLREYLASP